MKKTLMVTVVMGAFCCAFAQQGSLSEARAQIGAAIADSAVMTSTISKLSADDQKKFLADVNEAISKMPGSVEMKSATFLSANRAALKGAQKGNLSDLLAEVFATVPLEALTVLNENFASDLFNRAANPAVTYTDEQFVKLSQDALVKVVARNAEVDDGAARTGFAILMFTRASNGSPAGLADTLAEVLPENVRETAKKEWFPAALADGESKSYDPMIGESDVGQLPNEQVVLRLAHVQTLEALLSDLAAGNLTAGNLDNFRSAPLGVDRGGIGAGLDNGLYRVPFFYDRKVIGTQAGQKGSDRPIGSGKRSVALVDTPLVFPGGYVTPPGAKAGDKPVTVITPIGQQQTIGPHGEIPGGSTVVPPPGGGGTTIVVPPGTPLAPGGMPVGPGGKPVGPGRKPIEPGGYDWQR